MDVYAHLRPPGFQPARAQIEALRNTNPEDCEPFHLDQ